MICVAATSAFEAPIARLASVQVSSLELATALALTAAACALVWSGRVADVALPLARPVATGLVVAVAAALVAPSDTPNALRFCGRLVACAAVAFVTARAIVTRAQARALVATLLAVGALVGFVALLEVRQVPGIQQALTLFRPGFHVVGGQLRATSTFVYPTVASMYLEVVFALGLWWLVEPPAVRSRVVRVLPGVALTLVAAGVVATFTRAGLLALMASLVTVGGLRQWARPGFDGPTRALAAMAAVVVLLAALSRSPEAWRSRVSTDIAQDWYGANYDVPRRLSLDAGTQSEVPITVTNDGLLTWQSEHEPVFALSYHWLVAGSGLVAEFDGQRTAFPRDVAPGDRITVPVRVRAPERAGDYVLAWDIVHEGRTWLSTEGIESPRSTVAVNGAPSRAPIVTHGRLPGASARLPRLALWRAALAVVAAHPIGGVGPDNFRQVYGAYLGLAAWDRRVHTNNLYLEALTGAGPAGLVAVCWVFSAALQRVWRQWRDAATPAGLPGVLLAAGVAIAGHGLVDAFFAFTSTYVVFALTAGLACSPSLGALGGHGAHRV